MPLLRYNVWNDATLWYFMQSRNLERTSKQCQSIPAVVPAPYPSKRSSNSAIKYRRPSSLSMSAPTTLNREDKATLYLPRLHVLINRLSSTGWV